MSQLLYIETVLRYSKQTRIDLPVVDGLLNFHHVTRDSRPGSRGAQLEKGINAMAHVRAADGVRRPAILIRSSPPKAGTAETPWEDVIDLESGRITYFGDHRANTSGPLGSTSGNAALELAWELYSQTSVEARLAAPPLLVFVTTRWFGLLNDVREKGAVRFLGPAVLEEMEPIIAEDARTGAKYPNYRTGLRLTNLNTNEQVIDWQWVNDRKNHLLRLPEATEHEPANWTTWRWSGSSR